MAPALTPKRSSTVGRTSCGSPARSVQDFLYFALGDLYVQVLGKAGHGSVSFPPAPDLKVLPRDS